MDMGSNYVLNYDYLLSRLYKKLPVRTRQTTEFILPELQITYIGVHTHIKNFKEICDRLRREPKVMMKYLLKELATPGTLDPHGTLIIHSRFSPQTILNLLRRFLVMYVKCSTCGSYDTILIRQGKIWIVRCLACGAETPVKPI